MNNVNKFKNERKKIKINKINTKQKQNKSFKMIEDTSI